MEGNRGKNVNEIRGNYLGWPERKCVMKKRILIWKKENKSKTLINFIYEFN